MLKSEKVSSKRKNYEDLPFSSGYSLNLIEKSYGLKQTQFFDICVSFLFSFLNNYLASSQIKCLTERNKVSYTIFKYTNDYAQRFEKKTWPKKVFPVFWKLILFFLQKLTC